MSNNPTNQEKNKEPKQKAQTTVKTAVAKHCLTESIAVNIIMRTAVFSFWLHCNNEYISDLRY